MTVKHSGVLTHVQAVAPDTTCEHCSIHREALATKGPPLRMFWTLQWKWWTWWKPGPWTLASLLHYAVKRVATELNDELNIWIIFFTCQTICTMLFLTRQVYLGVTFSHLDGLLGLLGALHNRVQTAWTTTKQGSSRSCMIFSCANQLGVTDSVKLDVTTHLSGPAAGGRIPHPFSDVPAALPASEQESLTEVPTSGSMKIEFNQKAFARFLDRTAHRVPSTSQPSCKDFEALCHQVLMWEWVLAIGKHENKMQAQTVRGKGFKTQTLSNSAKHCRVTCLLLSTFSLTCGTSAFGFYMLNIYMLGGGDRLYFLCNSHEDAE